MTTTESVLARIDEALDAGGTVSAAGSDAMRWVPGRVICDGGKPLRIGRMPTHGIRISEAALAEFGRQVTAMFGSWATAFARFTESVRLAAKAMERSFHPGHGRGRPEAPGPLPHLQPARQPSAPRQRRTRVQQAQESPAAKGAAIG